MRAGTNLRERGGVVLSLKAITRHPNFDADTFNFDVAVVKTCQCLDYSEQIYRVELPPPSLRLPENTIARLTGFGRIFVSDDQKWRALQ